MVDDDGRLGRLAEWLSTWGWPMTKDRVLEVTKDFGWTVTSNRPGKGARWDTGMPAPGASASVLDDVVADLQIRTSERVDDDPAGRRALMDLFADQVDSVVQVLGSPSRQKPGGDPSAVWSLPNGSELTVGASTASCFWVLTSPKFVQIEQSLRAQR